jgi:hypothetical protein
MFGSSFRFPFSSRTLFEPIAIRHKMVRHRILMYIGTRRYSNPRSFDAVVVAFTDVSRRRSSFLLCSEAVAQWPSQRWPLNRYGSLWVPNPPSGEEFSIRCNFSWHCVDFRQFQSCFIDSQVVECQNVERQISTFEGTEMSDPSKSCYMDVYCFHVL